MNSTHQTAIVYQVLWKNSVRNHFKPSLEHFRFWFAYFISNTEKFQINLEKWNTGSRRFLNLKIGTHRVSDMENVLVIFSQFFKQQLMLISKSEHKLGNLCSLFEMSIRCCSKNCENITKKFSMSETLCVPIFKFRNLLELLFHLSILIWNFSVF